MRDSELRKRERIEILSLNIDRTEPQLPEHVEIRDTGKFLYGHVLKKEVVLDLGGCNLKVKKTVVETKVIVIIQLVAGTSNTVEIEVIKPCDNGVSKLVLSVNRNVVLLSRHIAE